MSRVGPETAAPAGAVTLEQVQAAYRDFEKASGSGASFASLFLNRKTKDGKNNNAHPYVLRLADEPVSVRDLPPEKYATVAKHVALWIEHKRDDDAKAAGMIATLNAHGKEIAARIQIADKALVELKEKSGAALKTFVDHRHAIAKMLADAKDECKAAKVPFEEFRKKYAPNFQRTLTYELIAIGQGKLTLEDRTAAETKRKQKSRAAAKVRAAAEPQPQQHTDTVVRGADGKPIDTSGFGGPAKVQLEAELARTNGTVVEPGIPEPPAERVLSVEAQSSADQYAEFQASRSSEPPPTTPAVPALVPALDLMPETLEQCLDRMMAEARELKSVVPAHTVCVRCIAYLAPLMNEGTRAQLRKEISAITNRADTVSRKVA